MKRNIVIAAVTAAVLVGGGTATALATTGDDAPSTAPHTDDDGARVTSVKVSAGDAVASALREAPGTALSAELDDDGDDGERAAWEVDVLAGDGTWHSVRIDPSSGKVLGSQTESEDDTDDTAEARAALKGTSVDAAGAAKAAAGHGTVTSVELDDDGDHGGGAAWEVDTRTSGKAEQDWRVDGKTGKVTADRPDDSGSDDSDGSDSGSDDSGPDDD
ncbi:PepSY domain-containing protein [Streptomyces sp. CL12-4]|uniref:PepSY domain-containing protein n=1 Tax=Streptomyces sp. CL12-4 TaxID=2810306 RepID=UPI001EFB3BF7|nr:PepSY domain-containing protein [Streptomyces sp. CL12-4]MCG8964476.1 PepSY domain-containing protein [Streptomyces sp. CL12-4]